MPGAYWGEISQVSRTVDLVADVRPATAYPYVSKSIQNYFHGMPSIARVSKRIQTYPNVSKMRCVSKTSGPKSIKRIQTYPKVSKRIQTYPKLHVNMTGQGCCTCFQSRFLDPRDPPKYGWGGPGPAKWGIHASELPPVVATYVLLGSHLLPGLGMHPFMQTL